MDQNKRTDGFSIKTGQRRIKYNGTAVVNCSGNLPHRELELNDNEDWELAADIAVLWANEKRKNTSVSISILYGNKPRKRKIYDDFRTSITISWAFRWDSERDLVGR